MTWHYSAVSIILIVLLFGVQYSFAVPVLSASTKPVYEYGDFLIVTFQVSELTGDPIILHIVDESGNASSPIPIQISKLNSTIIAPIPFYKTNYLPGTYTISAEYSGAKTSISFDLVDSDKIAIPTQYKIMIINTIAPITEYSTSCFLVKCRDEFTDSCNEETILSRGDFMVFSVACDGCCVAEVFCGLGCCVSPGFFS